MAEDPRSVETELQAGFEIGIPAGLPFAARLQGQVTKRYRDRADDFAGELSASPERIAERLEQSERLDALFLTAAQMAALSAEKGKRRLLGQLIDQAILDDAKVDHAELLVGILRQVDGPHVRALEAIRRAEAVAEELGEIEARAEGAERAIVARIKEAGDQQPPPVLTLLVSLHLLTSASTWNGSILATGQRILAATCWRTYEWPLARTTNGRSSRPPCSGASGRCRSSWLPRAAPAGTTRPRIWAPA